MQLCESPENAENLAFFDNTNQTLCRDCQPNQYLSCPQDVTQGRGWIPPARKCHFAHTDSRQTRYNGGD